MHGRAAAAALCLALVARGAPARADAPSASDAKPADGDDPATPWVDQGAWPKTRQPERADYRWQSLTGLGGLYLGFSTWAYFAWYHNQPNLSSFEVGGDGYFGRYTYAGGADKLGHAWANLVLSRAGSAILRAGGWNETTAALTGAGLAWSLFLFVEIKDGYYYELSPGDMMANTAGAALGAAMDLVPAIDDWIDFRVAYYPSDEYIGLVEGEYHGDPQVNSLNIAEDYSGQTYFLGVHLGQIPLPSATPPVIESALDYLDVGVALATRNYKPDAPDDEIMSQTLFLGATLNLQHLLDETLGGRPGAAARGTRRVGRAVFEYLAPPYSIVPVVGGRRYGGRSGDH